MREETTEKTIFNYTAFISIGGILLYQLGWSYWETYLNNLNINSSFIEISIEKIISTTWTTIILVFLALVRSIEDVIKLKPNQTISLTNVIIYLAFGIMLIYTANNLKDGYMIPTLILAVIVTIITFFEKRINKLATLNRRNYIITIMIVGYFISFFYYPYLAKKDSKKMISDYKNDIEIILNHDNKTIKGKFITFMNDKYFILIENHKCQIETLVINNSEVSNSKFSKTNK
ncbi:MAG: hypothetical protein ABIP27_06025 [Flavobacterium circumlabens]|uniref:hypothetical protein n=1 Tax=Flavobacterium circumlabens TaxID=2133765 RepID=UPI0032651AD9